MRRRSFTCKYRYFDKSLNTLITPVTVQDIVSELIINNLKISAMETKATFFTRKTNIVSFENKLCGSMNYSSCRNEFSSTRGLHIFKSCQLVGSYSCRNIFLFIHRQFLHFVFHWTSMCFRHMEYFNLYWRLQVWAHAAEIFSPLVQWFLSSNSLQSRECFRTPLFPYVKQEMARCFLLMSTMDINSARPHLKMLTFADPLEILKIFFCLLLVLSLRCKPDVLRVKVSTYLEIIWFCLSIF